VNPTWQRSSPAEHGRDVRRGTVYLGSLDNNLYAVSSAGKDQARAVRTFFMPRG